MKLLREARDESQALKEARKILRPVCDDRSMMFWDSEVRRVVNLNVHRAIREGRQQGAGRGREGAA